MSLAVTFGKVMLRNAYTLLRQKTNWDSVLILDPLTRADLDWWLLEMASPRKRVIEVRTVDCQLVVDASQTGWGASLDGVPAAGFWNTSLSFAHSNYRELLAVLLAILSFEVPLTGKCLEVFTDNITTRAYVIHQGGPDPLFNRLARAIWVTASRLSLHLVCHHILGMDNCVADTLSRLPDKYNWRLNPQVFRQIDHVFGPHTIDRMADGVNTQLPRFNSRYLDPNSIGVDCFAQTNWATEVNFVNPPFVCWAKFWTF
jgi:hypothetical protein